MTICDGCNRDHPQTTTYLTAADATGLCHIKSFCTPCWPYETYFDTLRKSRLGEGKAA